eukprot:TRINITY_DN2715_c0_g1_i1.p1 TRINITY_DN2715_c0_g1~~TRINITY_DN2715_c0_g1_i1.p1  ORF type:complete len:493 (-),score=172.74 TRINITY_DN2715_c0_g1_i1:310-1788(-)
MESADISARARKDKQFLNFLIWKKNEKDQYQLRVFQIDLTTNTLKTLLREDIKRSFNFAEIQCVVRDEKSPLAFRVEFSNYRTFDCVARTIRDRTLFCDVLSKCVENAGKGKVTEVTIKRNILKEGGATKKTGFSWSRRYLVLYPYQLYSYRYDVSERPLAVIDLFGTPISLGGDKFIHIHMHGTNEYVFNFDTQPERDAWFEALVKASHFEDMYTHEKSHDVSFSELAEERRRALKKQVEELRTLLSDEVAVVENYEQKTQECRAEKEIAERDFVEAEGKVESQKLSLDRILRQMEQTKEEGVALEKAAEAAEESLSENQEKLEEAKKRVDVIQDKLKGIATKKTTASEQLKKQERERDEIKEELETKVEEVEGLEKEVEKINAEMETMKEEKVSKERSLERILGRLEDVNDDLDALNPQLQAIRTSKSQVGDRMSLAEEEVAKKKKEEARIVAELEKLHKQQAELEELRGKLNEKKVELDGLEDAIAALE